MDEGERGEARAAAPAPASSTPLGSVPVAHPVAACTDQSALQVALASLQTHELLRLAAALVLQPVLRALVAAHEGPSTSARAGQWALSPADGATLLARSNVDPPAPSVRKRAGEALVGVCNTAFVAAALLGAVVGRERNALQLAVARDFCAAVTASGSRFGEHALSCSVAPPGYINVEMRLEEGGGVEAAGALRQQLALELESSGSHPQPGTAAAVVVQPPPSLDLLLSRIPHALHSGNARTADEWSALREHHRRLQEAREVAGAAALIADPLNPHLQRDEMTIALSEADVSSTDSSGEEEEDGDPEAQEKGSEEVEVTVGEGGQLFLPPPRSRIVRHRVTRAQKLAAAKAKRESHKVTEDRLEQELEVSDSAEAGMGSFAAELRARAVADRAARGGRGPLLPFGDGRHTLTVTLVRPTLHSAERIREAQELYGRFNSALHRGRPDSQTASHLVSHLVATPILPLPGWRVGQLHAAAKGGVERTAWRETAAVVSAAVHGGGPVPPTAWESECSRLAVALEEAGVLGAEGLTPDPDSRGTIDALVAADGAPRHSLLPWAADAAANMLLIGRRFEATDAAAQPALAALVPRPGATPKLLRQAGQRVGARCTLLAQGAPPLTAAPLPRALAQLPSLLRHVSASTGMPPGILLLLIYSLASALLDEAQVALQAHAQWTAEVAALRDADAAAAEQWAGGKCADAPPPVPPHPVTAASDPEWLSQHVLVGRWIALSSAQKDVLHWLCRAARSQLAGVEGMVAEYASDVSAGPVGDGTEEGHGRATGDLPACAIDAFFTRGYTPGSARLGATHAPPGATVTTVVPSSGAPEGLADDDLRIIVSGWDLPFGYGSFHQEYCLDGVLIAVSALDLLPTRVASVYMVYNVDLRDSLQLGKLSALIEVWLTRALHAFGTTHPQFVTGLPRFFRPSAAARAPRGWGGVMEEDEFDGETEEEEFEADLASAIAMSLEGEDGGGREESTPQLTPGYGPLLRHLDFNFYVHACGAMSYKRDFAPSQLKCPVTVCVPAYDRAWPDPWVPLRASTLQLLDADPGGALIDLPTAASMAQRLQMGVVVPFPAETTAEAECSGPQDARAAFWASYRARQAAATAVASAVSRAESAEVSSSLRHVLVQLALERGGDVVPYGGLNASSQDLCRLSGRAWGAAVGPALLSRVVMDVSFPFQVGWYARQAAEARATAAAARSARSAARATRRAARDGPDSMIASFAVR